MRTRPAWPLAAALTLLLLLGAGAADPVPASAAAAPGGRVVVKYRTGAGARTLRLAQASYGARSVAERPRLGAQVWQVEPGREEWVAAQLATRWDVEYAEPDRVVLATGAATDPLYATNQWDMRKIGLESAWDTTTGSAGVRVAVIDTGFDPTHPDAPTSLALGCDYVAWTGAGACPAVTGDENGHGTHVAGVVAARQGNGVGISGAAPGAGVLVIRVLDANGGGYDSDVAAAIREAVDAGAGVINLSLGGGGASRTGRAAVDYALARGVVVVASAGNDYQEGNATSYPAAYPGVVAVAATTHDDRHASYSNTGDYVSIAAPGGNGGSGAINWITSLYPVARGSYARMVGTSQAAPHVAGVAALIRSARPDLSGEEVGRLLTASARPLGGTVPNQTFGFGEVDAAAALRLAQPATAPTATPTVTPTATPTRAPSPTAVAPAPASGGGGGGAPAPPPPPPTAPPSQTATPPPRPPTATPRLPSPTASPTAWPTVPPPPTATAPPSPALDGPTRRAPSAGVRLLLPLGLR